MRRFAPLGRRAATVAALALVPGLWACESQPTEPSVQRPRVFRVAMADGQLLPSHRECPSPVAGMVTGTSFVEGELILYPERTFTWRYTIQQYAAMEGIEQAWIEPAAVSGTYVQEGSTLDLRTSTDDARTATIDGERVTLAETVPCHFPVEGHGHHVAELELTPAGAEA